MVTYPQNAPSYELTTRQKWRALGGRQKALWIVAVLWCLLHVSGILGTLLFDPDYNRQNIANGSDLVAYLDAADAVRARAPLYQLTPWSGVMANYYHPLFALAFSVIADMPFRLLSVLGVLGQIACYLGGLIVWYRVLRFLTLDRAAHMYIAWLPVALMSTPFFANLAYWNLASTLLLLSGLLVLAILKERLLTAVLLALPVALTKPQWLFPLLLLLVFRRWKFLAQLIVGLCIAYLAVNVSYLVLVGPTYGLQSLQDYATFLARLDQNYPWEGQSPVFLHMNHSWRQIFLHYFGPEPWVPVASAAAKVLMTAALGWQVLRAWQRRVTVQDYPQLVMLFTWSGYLVAMAMLGQLWELIGGVIIFIFIQSADQRTVRVFSRLFLVYLFSEVLIILGLATKWDWLVLSQSIPQTMLALLVLFVAALILIHRQLNVRERLQEATP